jgi:hypothetical protein
MTDVLFIVCASTQVAKGTIDQLANPPQWPKGWYAGIAFGSSLLVASAGLASMAYDSAESFAWLILLATIYVGHCKWAALVPSLLENGKAWVSTPCLALISLHCVMSVAVTRLFPLQCLKETS